MEKEKVKSLFVDPLPPIKNNRELDVIKAGLPGLDDYYIASGCISDRRIIFERLWGKYEPYADDDFLHQHRLAFHQKSWEMYLGYLFLEEGFKLAKASNNRPDLCLLTQHGKLWVEAIAPTHGRGPNSVPEMRIGVLQNVPFDQIVLRISAALKEKFEKQQKYLRDGAIGAKEPFVIAVNRGFYSIGDPYDMPLVMQSLFAMGHLTISFTPGRPKKSVYYARRPSLSKVTGNTVPMTFFEDPAHSSISAVIYSTRNVLGSAIDSFATGEFGRDCVVIHNPLADNPIPYERFCFLTQYHVDKNGYVQKI